MDFSYYQRHARSTAVYTGPARDESEQLLYVALGLVGEAGEVANCVKKILRDDGGVLEDAVARRLVDELGDVMWYVAMMAQEIGVGLDVVAARNLSKLAARHG